MSAFKVVVSIKSPEGVFTILMKIVDEALNKTDILKYLASTSYTTCKDKSETQDHEVIGIANFKH